MEKHRHVVIGGGFSGLRIARLLANRNDITIIVVNPQLNFEYHGSLYRSANGYSPLETAIPYREIFRDTSIEYLQDFMVDIDPAAKKIKLLSGNSISYDSATLALGYEPEYFGIPGMREFSQTLYSLADALKLRGSLLSLAHDSVQKSAAAKVVVVGGGPTGVEVAATIPHFFKLAANSNNVEVVLIEAQKRILSGLAESISPIAVQSLSKKIEILCNRKVIRATKGLLHFADAQPLHFDILVWTAGSSANCYFRQRPDLFEVDSKGRVLVDEFLRSRHDSLYVTGDSAAVQYSGTAHAAIEMGSYVADQIICKLHNSDLTKFRPTQPDYAVPTGHETAVALKAEGNLKGLEGWKFRRKLDLDALSKIAPSDVAHDHWMKGEGLAVALNKS